MSRTSETPASDSPDLRCNCGKCLAKDGQIKCSKCSGITDARPRMLDDARHTAFYLSAMATTAQLLGANQAPVKVTIVPGRQHLGYVASQPLQDPLYTTEDMRRQLLVLLTGHAAEIALGGQTTGSQNTMERAWQLAQRMVSLGMADGWNRNPDEAARTLFEAVRKEAQDFVSANRAAIESVAAMLLFKGELTGDDVARLAAAGSGATPQ